MPQLTLILPLLPPPSILLRGSCWPKSPVSWGRGDERARRMWGYFVLTVRISLLGHRAGRGEGNVAFGTDTQMSPQSGSTSSPFSGKQFLLPATALLPPLSPGALSCHSPLGRRGPSLWSAWGLTRSLALSGNQWLLSGASNDTVLVLPCPPPKPNQMRGFLEFKGLP